jgi:hypothetical protein
MTIANLTKKMFGATADNEAKLMNIFGIQGVELTYPEFKQCVELAQAIGQKKNVQLTANWGGITTEQALIRILTQRAIEKASNLLTEGLEMVYQERMTDLEQKFAEHTRMEAQYGVPEGASGRRQTLYWNKYDMAIEPAVVSFTISDHAKVRGEAVIQQRSAMREAALAIATTRRNNIINTLYAGALSGNAVTKAAVWTGSSADVMLDLATMYGKILANGPDLPINDVMAGFFCLYPAELAGFVKDVRDAATPNVSHQRQVEDAFSVKLRPTRAYHASETAGTLGYGVGDGALCVIKSPQVAIHGTLQGGIIPLVETQREIGVGQLWVIREFFGTKVVPSAWTDPSTVSDATNPGIGYIDDVL